MKFVITWARCYFTSIAVRRCRKFIWFSLDTQRGTVSLMPEVFTAQSLSERKQTSNRRNATDSFPLSPFMSLLSTSFQFMKKKQKTNENLPLPLCPEPPCCSACITMKRFLPFSDWKRPSSTTDRPPSCLRRFSFLQVLVSVGGDRDSVSSPIPEASSLLTKSPAMNCHYGWQHCHQSLYTLPKHEMHSWVIRVIIRQVMRTDGFKHIYNSMKLYYYWLYKLYKMLRNKKKTKTGKSYPMQICQKLHNHSYI